MPSGKELKALVSISGQVDPSLGKSISSASTSMKGFEKAAKTVSKVAAVAIAAAAGAAVAAGKALVDLGAEFKDAENTIRVGTGATGKDLEDLYSTMEEVYKNVPTTLEDASSVIADYNTRLGLTGDDLQGLSTQAIQVADMLGEDVSTVVEESSQAFQQWNISTDDMGAAMDYMFKVSQSTGMGFTELMSSMQSYGAQLQEMGYSYEEAAALMGQLDKAGVNTSEVLGAMKKSVTAMAKEGKSAKKGLTEYYTAIKEAGSATEATSIASEVFGSRAASTMSAAIRNGTLDVESLTSALEGSSETIGGAAEDTYTFADKWQMVKQNIETAVEPLATSLVEALESAMPYITQVVEDLQPQIEDFAEQLGPMIQDFAENKLPDLVDGVANLASGVGDAIGWIVDNWDTISKVGPMIQDFAENKLPDLVDGVGDVISWIADHWDVISKVGPVIAVAAVAIGPLSSAISGIGSVVKTVGSGIGGLVGKFSNVGSAAASATPAVAGASASFSSMAGQALLLVAAGAAVMLIAGAMWILVQAAIQLAEAGPAAVGVFVLLAGVAVGVTAAIVAIGSAATVSAVGLLAMGAAVLMVGTGIAIAAAGAALFCTQLPTIATYGPAAAAGILMLSGAIIAFSASTLMMTASLLTGTVALVAFGASALVGSAGALAFGVSMGIAAASCGILLAALLGIQASVSTINSDATSAASALTGMADSVSVVQSVLNGLGDLASSAVDALLSIFASAAPEAQADGTLLGTSLATGLKTGLAQANASFLAGMLMLKVTAAAQLAQLQAQFARTKFSLNHDIDLPHFALNGSFDAKANKVPSVDVKWYAAGGFTDGLSIAGENGTEAVLSFDPAYRSQNLSYWAKAGQMLGVDSTIIDLITGKAASGNTTEISLGGVSFSPNISINGNATKEDVIAAIREEEPEFFDLLDRYLMMKGRESYGYNF
jgi:TP901 family phage tail tape measure protein